MSFAASVDVYRYLVTLTAGHDDDCLCRNCRRRRAWVRECYRLGGAAADAEITPRDRAWPARLPILPG